MQDTNKRSDALVIGLAVFATFFGAGSLIFPPFLGMESGTKWFLGFMLFIILDVGLAFVTIVAMINGDGSINGITGVIGKVPAFILNTTVIVCVGPLLIIPRTAATTYEMTVVPIAPGTNHVLVTIVYFAIVFALTIKPSRVIDIVGKFLTPVMVVALVVLITAGVLKPLGPVAPPAIDNVVAEGIINGYQAMDVLGALEFAIVICSTVTSRGYTEQKARTRITAHSCILAGALLFAIYCGLTYLGATYSTLDSIANVNQANLIVTITECLLGHFGVVMLGVIVGLACLTTAIGVTAASAQYFEEISGGKLKYGVVVGIACAFSAFVATFGLSTIISIATPILCIVYPVVVCLILLSFFRKKIRNLNVYRGAALAALIVSVLSVGVTYHLPFGFVNLLPLSEYQLNWILPTIVGGVIGALIPSKTDAPVTMPDQ